jgi:hypothetical protein
MTAPQSTIPAVLDAIIAGITAAADDSTQVIDGQPRNLEDDYIAIGFMQNPDQVAVSIQDTADSASLASVREVYEIACEVSSFVGDEDGQKAARDRAFQLLAVVDGVLAANRHPADIGGPAQIIVGGLLQGVIGTGVIATVQFTIRIDAWKE